MVRVPLAAYDEAFSKTHSHSLDWFLPKFNQPMPVDSTVDDDIAEVRKLVNHLVIPVALSAGVSWFSWDHSILESHRSLV